MRKAFTLIELLVVICIILVITALALPAFNSTRQKSIEDSVRIDIQKLKDACQQSRLLKGHYPIPTWPNSTMSYGTLSKSQVDCDVTTNDAGEYVDHWGTPFFYYPLPVSSRATSGRGYNIAEQTTLANPALTGGIFNDWLTRPHSELNMELYTIWQANGSPIRTTPIILVSGGRDRKIKCHTAYGVLNNLDYDDDIR